MGRYGKYRSTVKRLGRCSTINESLHKEAMIKIPGGSLWGMLSSEISPVAIKMHLYFILLQDSDGGVAYNEPRLIEILGISKNSYDVAIRELRGIGVIASRHPETHEEKRKTFSFLLA